MEENEIPLPPPSPEGGFEAGTSGPAPAVPPRRPLGHPLLRSVLFLVVALLSEGAAGYLLFLLATALGYDQFFRGVTSGSGGPFLASYLVIAAFLVLLTIPFVRFLDRSDLAKIGARWPRGGPRAAVGEAARMTLGALVVLGIWLAGIALVATVHVGGLSEAFRAGPAWWPGPAGGTAALVVLALAFLIQGGTEEWMVRGYIYHALRERWPWWVSALASSLLFSFLHAFNPDVSWVALVNIVLAGFVLAELVERSGSLWGATVAHGAWNFAEACLLSLPVSGFRMFRLLDLSIAGPPVLTGGGFGPEGSLLLTALALPLIWFLWPPRRAEAAAVAVVPADESARAAHVEHDLAEDAARRQSLVGLGGPLEGKDAVDDRA